MAEAVAGSTWQREFPLNSQASSHVFQTPPTVALGDFKRSIVTAAGTVGALTNLDNTPTVDPAGSAQVKIILSASETTAAGAGGHINIIGVDASGAEWDSIFISVDVEASTTNARAADVQSRIPAALVSGRIDSSVGAMAANVINATAIATDAIDADALAADVTTELQNGLLTTTAFNTKLGTPAGASVSADIAAVKAETASIQTDTNDLQTQVGTAGAGLTAVASAANLATLTGYVDTEVAAILAAVDAEIATLVTNVAAILLDTETDGVVLSTAQMQALADVILARGSAGVDNTAAADSLYEAIGFLKRASTASGNLVIYKTDGTTVFSTTVLGTNVDALPIERIGVAA